MRLAILLLSFLMTLVQGISGQSAKFSSQNGQVSIVSEAPLELIKAKTSKVNGVVDLSKQIFAFSVPIQSLQGFNSPLQREHFNENYMESGLYPNATFTGKLIDVIDISKPGIYQIRAKGILSIHGVKMERIIKGNVTVKENTLELKTDFTVLLKDHQIQIPKIVYQKISEEINVSLQMLLVQSN